MLQPLHDLRSWRSLLTATLYGSQAPLLPDQADNLARPSIGVSKSCPNPGLSCQSGDNTVADTCCMNYPGGQFALTQFWNSDPHAGPPGYLGPNNTWTIHGLWPDHCDGRFDSVCDCDRSGDCSSRNYKCSYSSCNKDYSSITRVLEKFEQPDLLAYMGEHWKGINGDEHLWQHEWSKHGTCVSTLEPQCYVNYTSAQEVVQYFHKAVEIYKTLPSFEWLAAANITPSEEKTYSRAEIEAALKAPRGVKAIIQCDFRHSHELREIWYHFVVRGSLQDGDFVASEPDFSGVGGSKDTCPEDGIRYLPKRERSENPSPTTTGGRLPPGETGKPAGKGRLVIKMDNGSERGCLISNGKWYNTLVGSSCATFMAREQSGGGFTLTSSKGPCGLGASNGFLCGRGAPSTTFKTINGMLTTADAKDATAFWSADSIPRGTEQREIHKSDSGSVRFEVQWTT